MAKPLEIDSVWEARIAEQIKGLQFGQVLVTVHEGQIVQIDRTERTRYPLSTKKVDNVEDRAGTLSNKQDIS